MADLASIMRRLAEEIEKEDREAQTAAEAAATQKRIADLEAQLKRADPTPHELSEAMDDITDEEYDLIRQHRAAKTEPKPKEEPKPEPKARTRPGRKKGNAYPWTVDDEGNVQRTDIAHIYSGDDEPDEVELPAAKEDEAA